MTKINSKMHFKKSRACTHMHVCVCSHECAHAWLYANMCVQSHLCRPCVPHCPRYNSFRSCKLLQMANGRYKWKLKHKWKIPSFLGSQLWKWKIRHFYGRLDPWGIYTIHLCIHIILHYPACISTPPSHLTDKMLMDVGIHVRMALRASVDSKANHLPPPRHAVRTDGRWQMVCVGCVCSK